MLTKESVVQEAAMTSDPHFGFGLVLTVGLTVLFWSFFSAQMRSKRQSTSGAIATDSVELKRLRQQCQQLQQQLQDALQAAQPLPQTEADDTSDLQQSDSSADLRQVQQAIIQQLQPLLTRYPSLQQLTRESPQLAHSLPTLFEPVENLLQTWDITPIGLPGEAVLYDPEVHHLDADEVRKGESVYIHFVGYRQGDRIFCPAVVSRTPPDFTDPEQALNPPIPQPAPELLPRPVRPDAPQPHPASTTAEGETVETETIETEPEAAAETADPWANSEFE